MVNRLELIDYANKKGLRIEEHFACSEIYTRKTFGYCFGLEMKEFIWYWFISFSERFDDDLFFSERYSCNTGRSIKSIRTGINAEFKIKSFLGCYE